MNDRFLFRALAIAALAVAAAAAIAVGAYNAGVAHGIAGSGRGITPPIGTPYVYGWPWAWGFGFFPIFPLFLFFVFVIFVVRGLLWRGPRRGWGCGYDGVPPAFDEWHRRAHGEQAPPARSTPSPT